MARLFRELKRGSTKALILSVLESKPMYGYQIIKKIRDQSQGYFDLSEGSLYPALHSLEREGFIGSYWKAIGGRERKYYQLTEKGARFLRQLLREWNSFVSNISVFLTQQGEQAGG
ncbi:MAG: PadR family transcriptional regulator [Acidobacteriota bacterium]